MFFSILQLAALVITTRLVYRSAKSNGHNAYLWAALNVVVFLLAPGLIGLAIGIGLGVAAGMGIISMDTAELWAGIVGFVMLGLGILGVYLILKHVSVLKDDDDFEPPPEPGFFNIK